MLNNKPGVNSPLSLRFNVLSKKISAQKMLYQKLRSIPPEVLCKIGVPKNFAKLTGNHLCQGLFLNKVPCLILKETLEQVPSCESWEIFKNIFFTEHVRVIASENIKNISEYLYNFKCFMSAKSVFTIIISLKL